MGFHKNLRGNDLHAPSNELVENNTLLTIPSLSVVALDGMGTVYPQIKLANPALYPNFGVTSSAISVGAIGYVCCMGFLLDINTSVWTAGTLLYSTAAGVLSSTPNLSPIAEVINQHATNGVIYVFNFGTTSVAALSWETSGNIGLNPATNFLGTTDAVPLNIRTNNLFRATIDASGKFGLGTASPVRHFEQKTHTSANASGLQQETFYVETSDTNNNTVIVIPIADPSSVKIEYVVTARQTDGGNRASFKRSGLFFRETSSVQIQGGWQSDFTQKSDNTMNVSYVLGVSSVTLRVKAASATTTRWSGHITVHEVT